MKRQTFIKTITAGTGTLFIPGSVFRNICLKLPGDGLENEFHNPSDAAKAFTWWHWMNGNVTADGITRDLEFLQKAGIGGFQLFQVGVHIPKGPVEFESSEWVNLLKHAAKEADRLGLEYDMMNGPGWSASGGPWITPELSMQQLTWSETHIQGGQTVHTKLPQPYTKLNYYRDAFVLAFPSLGGGGQSMGDLLQKVTTNNVPIDKNALTDGNLSDSVTVHPDKKGGQIHLQLAFSKPYRAQSIMLYSNPVHRYETSMILESSNDGRNYKKVCDLQVYRQPTYRTHGQPLEAPVTANFSSVEANYFRLTAQEACRFFEVRISGASQIVDWPTKANFKHRESVETGERLSPTQEISANSVIKANSVMDITRHMDENGLLHWQAPKGNWTILRLGHTSVGVKNHPAPDGGSGLECDKYSKHAYDYHFNHFFEKLFTFLESLGKKGKSGAIIDSYEESMQTWTKNYPQEFKKYRGYDIKKYLPALTGRVVESGEISDRFLWDIRRTDADLMRDNYYGRYVENCRKHNMKAYAETYRRGPFNEIEAASKMDVPMGEFWIHRIRQSESFYSVKMASSAAHLYGKKVVAAESYTGFADLTKWQQYPYAMKAEGDWGYTMGLNKLIFHVYAMQPHPTAKPGMTMGQHGWMHSRNNTWEEHEKNWLSYVQRTQNLLQQGKVIADLVYYVGGEVPVMAPALPDQLNPSPPKGYYYDVTDANAILSRMKPVGGNIVLPDGMKYKVLVLPESDTMSLKLLKKIRDLVHAGVTIVGPKPEQTPGLGSYSSDKDKKLRQLADEIWGNLDGITKTERSFGRGNVVWGVSIEEVLEKMNVEPDFEFTSKSGDAPINFIHRQIKGSDVYFIANRRRKAEDLVCTFRVNGKKPEFWDPQTGEITSTGIYEHTDGRTRMPIHLGPAGSLFVVFRSSGKEGVCQIAKDGETILRTQPYSMPEDGKYDSLTNDFSISLWVKPDVDINLSNPNTFAIYPPAGSKLYGSDNVACGLAVGRNGAAIFERSVDPFINEQVKERQKDSLKNVLTVKQPLSGWTHLTVIYEAGAPSLYVDGKLAGQQNKSGYTVHPGLGEANQDDGAFYFAGEMSKPELFSDVLDESRIKKLANDDIPAPEEPPTIEPVGKSNPALRIWQNGNYTLQGGNGQTTSVKVSDNEDPKQIEGPWKVSFPPNLGAPDQITLDKLISLKDHPNDRVKYFSGTATYSKTMNIPSDFVSSDKHLFLDLGWVEVIANVRLNKKSVGTVWKKPYRIEITDLAHTGKNNLEIQVTNLWPNRLIGDEHLPAENEYFDNGAIKKLPDWYTQGKPKPGKRITFATWKFYDKNDPLLEAGLLGPVKLRTAIQKEIRM